MNILIENGAVVTVDDAGHVHNPGYLFLADDRISAVGRGAQFALELREWGVDNRRNKFYREWFARRLPGWDSRLLNPQRAAA